MKINKMKEMNEHSIYLKTYNIIYQFLVGGSKGSLKPLLHGKASIMIIVSSTKKYSVNSAITLYHATFRSCMIHTLWYQ
jgi:hypothetical protein